MKLLIALLLCAPMAFGQIIGRSSFYTPAQAAAAPAADSVMYDATASKAITTADSFQITIANNANRCIVVIGYGDYNTSPNAPFVDGTQTTLDTSYAGASGLKIWMYHLVNPTAGTVWVAYRTANDWFRYLGAVSCYGVHQTTPLRFRDVTGANQAGDTLTVTTTTTDMIIAGIVSGDAITGYSAGQTQAYKSANNRNAATYMRPTGTSETIFFEGASAWESFGAISLQKP